MNQPDDVAVVTGASSGVGAATARALASDGYAVALAARREHRLEDLAAEIEAERDADALAVPTDVTDEHAVEAMVDATLEEFGRVDVLVNNAGVLEGDYVADADPADFRSQVEVNLLGSMYATRAALPALRDGGHVVGISSMNADEPAEGGSAYSASKAGVNGFYDAFRKEMADDPVRVTVVNPGPIQSEMNDWSDWDGRPLDPRDVAATVAFAIGRPQHVELPRLTVNTTDKLSS
ncbi:SDR family oxidoreductase [Halorubellus sp. JP-L1]|uniref:SDR family oxidoreductase n=1 Tax=Halorubellus sp. JP-L1 TaxID=2715753 RepID=UPI00140E6680|nr:SDR family oxidoreductase [Halorubellus sp. JP-L1]NHN40990.1 SDR family oxidoreductase [Halorubellus sp. JP-L1]